MSNLNDAPLGAPDDAPKCTKCGHPPCPSCETWCDVLWWSGTCPKCAGFFKLEEGTKDGDDLTCPICEHAFNLVWVEHVEPELCCESACVYEMPAEEVRAWCGRELKRQMEEQAKEEAENEN